MKQPIATDQAPAAIGPYSQAIQCGPFLFTSGQIPLDPATGQLVTGDIATQTRRVLDNVKAILAAVGVSMDQVAKTTVFVKNMADFDAINKVYAEYFPDPAPARSLVEVSRLPKDVGLEIETITFIGHGQSHPAKNSDGCGCGSH